MHLLEAIRIALQSLWANKLRSALTLIGVVIGVAAVIAVVTFVSGINDYVSEKIFDLGAGLRYWILIERQADWATAIWTSGLFGLVVLSASIFIFHKRDF